VPEILPFVQLGALGVLVALLYYLARILARGDWVPRTTVDTLLEARDAEILRSNQRAEAYMALFETERTAREVAMSQNGDLLDVARTVEQVMEALRQVAEGRGSRVE
jgi:regulator of protease activity HflC (stomatin/prohibitin superfamily)